MKKILYVAMTVMLVVMLAVVASATTTLTFDLEETTTDDGQPVNVIVATMTDDVGDWRALKLDIAFDNGIIVPVDYIDGSIPDYSDEEVATYPFAFGSYKTGRSTTEISIVDGPNWVMNGANSTMGFESYWSQLEKYPIDAAEGFVVFELFFKFADGKTANDLVYTSFQPTYAKYTGGQYFHFIGNADASLNDIVVVNNVVPEAPVVVPVTIPVLAGDKVYLQDGTVATMAEANDAYEVPATVGYVAVNTGKTAQKTYYVDGTAATLVHTNGIVSTEKNHLRGPDEKSSVAEDTSGLRFLMNHNPTNEDGRFTPGHEITEIGVLMTVESNKVIAGIGQETIDNLKVENVGSFVKSGYALGNGYDRAFNTENDTNWVISAVMYNIKLTPANVQTGIVCRPFYKVGDTYIYGETMKATLYDVAKSIKDGGYVGCSDELKAYVDEIVTLVDGVDTPVVEGEVIIDISSLYTAVC